MSETYILKRDGQFKFETVLSGENPLFGNGSWDLFFSRPFPSVAEAEATLETWAIAVASVALDFVHKRATFRQLKETIIDR